MKRAAGAVVAAAVWAMGTPVGAAEGVPPAGTEDAALNLGFERGTLEGWVAKGEAFARQPVEGDAVSRRRSDMKSGHAGKYWIGTYEVGQDKLKGTLTSAPFEVTHPFASFLVGGGAREGTRVEVVRAADQGVFFKASGENVEDMKRVVVDLTPLKGQRVFLRLVDEETGPWGHINFDDFRFHAERPVVEPRQALQADAVKHEGLRPEEAARAITLPEGFSATLFAGEPDVNQPVGFAIDDRGRLWVAEAHTYPVRQPEGQGKDRILIFEDTDGDGRADKRTVFMEGLNLVSGIEVGFGGVWVGAAPELLFIPDRDGDDKPDGPAQVLLDGWGWQDTHETLNAFTWGPDGWLYGCHGVFTHSRVGRPGTPDDQRVPLNAAVWRYHPTKQVFEVFAEGTSNPWGVDFNDQGQAFITACVIPHLYHVIQGARYQRQAGQHFNVHTYADIQTIGDHVHWAGAGGPHAGNNKSDAAGGGHAHCGAMVYLGDQFPAEYRNTIFMGNIHGNRINNDGFTAKGSGYVGTHRPDFMMMNDKWSRLINFKYGPDGSVYALDWYDKQACHSMNTEIWDRTNGRIYTVKYGNPEHRAVDLAKLSDEELVRLQLHPNDWYVRHARRLLQERGAEPGTVAALRTMLLEHADPTRRLRAMWALHGMGAFTDDVALRSLEDGDPHVRAWAIQLLTEAGTPSGGVIERLARLAEEDGSPVVRLYLASALQRMPVGSRWPVLFALAKHAEDADDHNLPLMLWYAAEPAVAADVARGTELVRASRIPLLRQFAARRLASLALGREASQAGVDALAGLLLSTDDAAFHLDVLNGMSDAFRGQPRLAEPRGWARVHEKLAASANADVRARTQTLSTTFGDERALAVLREQVRDASARPADRLKAIEALAAARDPKLPPILQASLSDPVVRSAAVRGLGAIDDPQTARALLEVYGQLDGPTRTEALNTLSSRVSYAGVLREAIDANKVPKSDLTPAVMRQLRNLDDADTNKWIAASFGAVRGTAKDKLAEIDAFRKLLHPAAIEQADASRGRAVFNRTCLQCHTLFDAGGKVGPDLTGSDRANVEYFLENVVDPSAVVGKEYLTNVVRMNDGRVLSGMVKAENDSSVTLVTETETLVLPRAQITRIRQHNVSMMPEGLLDGMPEQDLRDLVAYLRSPGQVPLLATAENADSLFNGKDLAGWSGDPKVWSVEDGEIVGRSAEGLRENAFLISDLAADDFRLTLEVKLVKNEGNSGIQFRSRPVGKGDVKGYQADVGPGWWGKLYEEHGREILSGRSGEAHVRPGEWNTYEIVAVGDRVRTFINGQPCVDLSDPQGARRGIFALQVHSGGPTEVRFRNLRLEVGPAEAVSGAK